MFLKLTRQREVATQVSKDDVRMHLRTGLCSGPVGGIAKLPGPPGCISGDHHAA